MKGTARLTTAEFVNALRPGAQRDNSPYARLDAQRPAREAPRWRCHGNPYRLPIPQLRERVSVQDLLPMLASESAQRDPFAGTMHIDAEALRLRQYDVGGASSSVLGHTMTAMVGLSRRDGLAGCSSMPHARLPFGTGVERRSSCPIEGYAGDVTAGQKRSTCPSRSRHAGLGVLS
jgi:hypothetical protein